jgi:preprotein translocase subunit SecG
MSNLLTNLSSIALSLGAVLLISVILLQRGRGGGLAGAFGGSGGQSAFGTKAGDVFTRITIGIAIVWVTLAVVTGYAMNV